MTPATLNTLGDSLKAEVQQLVLIEPSDDSMEVIGSVQLASFKAKKGELVTAIRSLKITTPGDFALAGDMISGCDAVVAAIGTRFDEPIALANQKHKALTGARKEMAGDLLEAVAWLRGARAGYKAAVEAEEKRKAAEEQARLRAEAEAKQRAEAEAARIEAKRIADAAAEEKRLADEAAAELARTEREAAEAVALAAAEIEDPDEAMAAVAAAAEEAEKVEADRIERERVAAEQEAERQRQVEEAARLAEQAAQAPVVMPRMVVEPTLDKEEGVTWADNWVAEYEPTEALKAIVAAGALEYLSLNEKAINSAAKSQKSLARIPGVRVVNNKIEKRRKA